MKTVRLPLLLTVCLCLVVIAASCARSSRPAASTALPAATKAPTPLPPTPTPQPLARVTVPILLYHHLQALDADASEDWYDSTVTPEAFDEQMAYLSSHNYHSISVADLLAGLAGKQTLPENPVIITFDDGWADCYDVAYPILKQYKMGATFFISANWIENVDGVMSWAQIEEVSRAGIEIGSHSMTHPYLTESEPDMLAWELEDSKALLEKHVGKTVDTLAYPFGLYDDNVIAVAKAAGYRAGLTIYPGLYATPDNLFELNRINMSYNVDMDAFAAVLIPGPAEEKASGG